MKAAVPLIFLIGDSNQDLTDTPEPLDWPVEYYTTSEFTVTNNNKVTINKGCQGLYEIIVSCRVEADDGDPWHLGLSLNVNGSSVYNDHLAYAAFDQGGESGTAVLHSVIYLNSGDYIEITAWVDDGTSYVQEEGTRMMIRGIPMEGWNNAHGGQILKKETIRF